MKIVRILPIATVIFAAGLSLSAFALTPTPTPTLTPTVTPVAVLVDKFIADANSVVANDSSKMQITVQGCKTTSVSWSTLNKKMVLFLYDQGDVDPFQLDIDTDGNGSVDTIMMTGIWTKADLAGTKFNLALDGNLGVLNLNYGWRILNSWIDAFACKDDLTGYSGAPNHYLGTTQASFKMTAGTLNRTSTNTGALRVTVEGYGNTQASVANPPAAYPHMKFDLQMKGHWITPTPAP